MICIPYVYIPDPKAQGGGINDLICKSTALEQSSFKKCKFGKRKLWKLEIIKFGRDQK